jgi:hypothetical protein
MIGCWHVGPLLLAMTGWYTQPKRAKPLHLHIHSTFNLYRRGCCSSLWLPGRKSFRATLHTGTEPGMSPKSHEVRKMTSLKTATAAKQIEFRTDPKTEPPIRKAAQPCGEPQPTRTASPPTVSPIFLNTMPYPASGFGGPSLTSRKH